MTGFEHSNHDRTELTDQQIWETYMMLSRVESAFRCLKSSLGLRPNFHQIEARADAPLFISVLAYHLLHTIEYKLRQCGDHRSWASIREILSTHQRLTIEYNVKSRTKFSAVIYSCSARRSRNTARATNA